ncbi:hypothetical protein K2173_020414 [Erythroxylum novogranatense]|uniref:non-specific serine/threonine protein kinase n=1 Tax=Erythroxylum novogranatense TaxID=1862640 RepID=A0AAV8TGP1_9ROSI|nr:hypothetical protein K2173_020414 [Erythroxylum novogranatense]
MEHRDSVTVSFKSWAQQMEESYQLQLALALRLSSRAASTNDPHVLDFDSDGQRKFASSFDSPEALIYRFWVNGSLSYCDRIPDGFYVIHGVDPYAWTLSSDVAWIPSFESLKAVDPRTEMSVKVVLIDRFKDSSLKELINKVSKLSHSWINPETAIGQLAKLVVNHMGGLLVAEGEAFGKHWMESAEVLKEHLGSVILPIGILSVGLCVHRALLFKVLADSINLPCRVAKGCKYCRKEVASSCLVQVGNDREYLVNLFDDPGALNNPDSSIDCASSILISSPLSHPKSRPIQRADDFRMLANIYFFQCQPPDCVFEDSPSDNNDGQHVKICSGLGNDKSNLQHTSSRSLVKKVAWKIKDITSFSHLNNMNSELVVKGPTFPSHASPLHVFHNPKQDGKNILPSLERNQLGASKSSGELHLEEEDLEIRWSELDLKENIGAGSFGTVHRADWCGSEVAVKILLEQDFDAERFREFLSEVAIMKRLRHPNIVLFMGAVTQPPNLSIITEYLSRGSLYKLLHMADAGLMLDESCRLNMAYDVAKGMNYLHLRRPPIVHRDLKSPNLLVDSAFTVKVCDFGLSRSKARTYLSSKTAAGTPEWMAPEVLRNEQSNEKSDVYSFGVILWELSTLQQPWRNLNQAQVVAEVGFKGERLEIPSNVNPMVAALIDLCLAQDPSERPPFSYIKETLQKLINSMYPKPRNAWGH